MEIQNVQTVHDERVIKFALVIAKSVQFIRSSKCNISIFAMEIGQMVTKHLHLNILQWQEAHFNNTDDHQNCL